MKAYIKTAQEKKREFERSELLRYFKILSFVLCQDFGFGVGRVQKFISLVKGYSDELYRDPEKWAQIDEYLIDKKQCLMFPRENIEERIEASADIHKEVGKKWRKY